MNPELRAVLTEALAGHQPENYGFNCSGCDWEPANPAVTDAAEFAAHQLDALDTAPGVAVIQLPKPTEAVTMQDCAGSGKPFKPATLSRDGEVAKCSACGTNRYVRDDGSIEPHQVPVAAVVAEGEGAK
ncbi:hypothetical protein COURTHOUSE_75 [Mycobacterium phage Courthouse]|uniref:Uncharacterized protein n=1 Tax=Mycobacterium phage Courthouse TaxID=2923000 RepID=G8I5D2_9CAUD|nr:hypothetical protein CM09_gp075 [Mycobacterium phage Courthouse]AER47926.1 hypothetical protein COURTHOUSE_75 [Mycobacterium phage Courthouse]